MDLQEIREWIIENRNIVVSISLGILIVLLLVFWVSGCRTEKVRVERGIVELSSETIEPLDGVEIVPLAEVPLEAYSESLRDGSQINAVGREARQELEAVFVNQPSQGAR